MRWRQAGWVYIVLLSLTQTRFLLKAQPKTQTLTVKITDNREVRRQTSLTPDVQVPCQVLHYP